MTQLRACYRAAAAGPVKVMAPMVADAGDVDLLLSLAERARDELAAEGHAIGEVDLGVMLEIPSAILVGGRLLRTDRLRQPRDERPPPVHAGGRPRQPGLERYRDALHPRSCAWSRLAVEAAARAGIELSVCGEMAGDPAAALALVGLGIRSLSMAGSSLPAVRRAIQGVRLADLEAAGPAALDERSAAARRTRFERLLPEGEPS